MNRYMLLMPLVVGLGLLPSLQTTRALNLNQTARGWHTQAALSCCCFFSACTAAVTSAV